MEDLKNTTTVMQNLFQARQQYTASTDWLPEMRKRMDNVVKEKMVEGEALATQAVSTDISADDSLAILNFFALRRGVMDVYASEATDNIQIKAPADRTEDRENH